LWEEIWLLLLSAGVIALLFPRIGRDGNHTRTRIAVALIWLTLAGLILAPAKGVIVYEYGLPGTPIPWGITVDRSGNVWVAEQSANRIARVYPNAGEYTIPTVGCVPWSVVASLDEEDIWFTEENGGKIGILVPSQNKFYEWQLPTTIDLLQPRPQGIAMNITKISANSYKRPRYDVWFTEFGRNRIGHLFAENPENVRFSFYTIPGVTDAQPRCIAMSPLDYSVWFTEYKTNRISSLKLLENGTAVFRHYAVAAPTAANIGLWGIGVDAAGFVWVVENVRNCIGKLNPVSGEYVTFAIPTQNSQPRELVVEIGDIPDRPLNIWFTEFNGDKVGRYDPRSNVFYEYPIVSAGGRPHGIAIATYGGGVGGYGDLWFTEPFAQKIGRIYNWNTPPLVTITTVGTISYATATSQTLSMSRLGTASSTASTTASTSVTTAATVSPTVVTTTYTFTSSQLLLTSTSIYSYTVSSGSTSSTTSTTATTTTQVTASVSTIPTTTTTTATSISLNIQTSSVTTSRTNTIFLTSTSLITTTVTKTSTSTYPTVTLTTANTSFISTTTFSPTATITSAQTYVVPTTSVATAILTATATTTTTVAITRPCIIASVAYGSELAPEVQFLRGYRDGPVMSTFAGAQFMRIFNAFYYSFSPSVAQFVGRDSFLSTVTRALITPLLACLHASTSVLTIPQLGQEAGIFTMGIVASALAGMTYLLPLLVVARAPRVFRRRLRATQGA
jgi:streptogramin lyase